LTPALTRALPRRLRRAFGLVDATFALILITIAASYGTRMVQRYMVQQAARAELQDIDAAAKAARGWVAAHLSSELTAAVPPHQIPISTLQAAGFWSPATPSITHRGRAVEIWDYSWNGSGVIVAAVAAGAITPPSIPAGDPTTGPTAWISPLKPTVGTGPGTMLDATPFISAAPGVFVPGAAMALQYVSFTADAEPYLFRSVVPGHPELNQMQTDLDLGQNAISNVSTLTTTSLDVTGTATASSAQIAGDTSVATTVTANNATVSGSLTAGAITVNGALTATTATTALGSLAATSATITGPVSAGTFDVTGQTTLNTATVTTLGTDTLAANAMTFNVLTVTGFLANQIATSSLTATTGLITTLTTSGCSGC
jgi:hypothetical protein